MEPSPTQPADATDPAQQVADFIAAYNQRTFAKIAEEAQNAEPASRALFADAERMRALDGAVNDKLRGIEPLYVTEAQAAIAVAFGRADAPGRVDQARQARLELEEDLGIREVRERIEASRVADFIAQNDGRQDWKVAEQAAALPRDMKKLLGDEQRMRAIAPRVHALLDHLDSERIERVSALARAALGRDASVDVVGAKIAPAQNSAAPETPVHATAMAQAFQGGDRAAAMHRFPELDGAYAALDAIATAARAHGLNPEQQATVAERARENVAAMLRAGQLPQVERAPGAPGTEHVPVQQR